MEERRIAGLVDLDTEAMGRIGGGGIIPTLTSNFFYDVFWAIGYAAGRTVGAVQWVAENAGTGSYSYAKVGTT